MNGTSGAPRATDPATDLATVRATGRAAEDMITSTRRGVIERMADPYLTDHDRWVLRQFAYFLSGLTPDPDPRAARVRPEGPLPQRVGRSRV